MDDDLLLPYSDTHGPSHSHQYVRDCQPTIHGNLTHETWLTSKHTGSPIVESKTFVSAIGSSVTWVSGHITVVHDPLRTVSVVEPGGPGGCKNFLRELVENTAKTRKCLIAQNGGYFITKNGQCLGNIVSDGRLVQNSGGVQNAQFGIRKDGTLVFGYLSEDEVLDRENPFVQLVSGVIWLLRSGEVYINESLQVECSSSQETGKLQEFVDVISARTAVGHDAKGRLILFQIDGQTKTRGMNLWQVAEFLKEQGVINAINLDGGGSSTYVRDGSLASFPSDHCKDPMWRCPRAVSTVLCVHERLCQPEDCNQHGTCLDGRCVCQPGWAAPTCANLTCQTPACGDHGLCTQGFYGLLCSQECQCSDLFPCDPVTGKCNATFHNQRNSSLHRGDTSRTDPAPSSSPSSPTMFQRFTSILFGDALEEASDCPADVGFNRNEDDDWILVDYLAEACSNACEGELIEVCSENMDVPDRPLRCSSCSSLDSAVDADPDDTGFLHLDGECGLEESWFITPPPCFTAGGRGPVLMETSPLENLLIEQPTEKHVCLCGA
ncbi:N-acetylglucosamine-1-phosphodiester alpha-N-acetylglucosaminidase [Bagarius yarrelli]|uniref:N-acetylglucosamine-1-phosphodiester alpha-N-acetylglucosaminidase n=1 Tax=Bagarius yarrelli TaxID=175774 RepID=A0A556V8R6_BAGYA|nr:N-acetylglucosamine-1-phosphodiester alpha-N-acetylglucosaminidase [Bagarius yarrelli]